MQKISSKREFHSNTLLPHNNNNSNKQSDFTPKGTIKRTKIKLVEYMK